VRIVGGIYRGRVFHPGKNFKARPTTDLAKESLFNILANRYNFNELEVLDLFSGTGSISYEFASRGCGKVTLVESDYIHIKFIKETIGRLQTSSILPIRSDVFTFLKKNRIQYSLIFADPPFDLPDIKSIPGLIFDSHSLKPDGVLIIEHSKNISFHGHPCFYELRKYGSVSFSFFQEE